MKKSTIIRSICLVVVIINMVLKTTGHDVLGIEDNDVAEFVEMVISVGIILLSWWKNNSVTKNAQKADQYLKKLKKLEEEQTNE